MRQKKLGEKILSKHYTYHWLILLCSGIVFFFPFLGKVHLFDWDEINFAESAREMLVTGNYTRVQINFEPFWEKPPLFFWLQAISMHVFGVNEWAARFPNAVFGLITLLTFYLIGKTHYDGRFGLLWALCYMGSFLPHFYFKSAIIDPVFNYFIFLGIYGLVRATSVKGTRLAAVWSFFAGAFTGLAILTKGPVGLLMVGLSFLVFWAWYGFSRLARWRDVLLFSLAAFITSFAWYGLELLQHGTWFIEEFIRYHIRLLTTPDAGHAQPFFYHFLVVFLGCFPMSVLALPAFSRQKHLPDTLYLRRWMLSLFWVVMIVFSLVKTKIVHYSSLAYFPLSFLAAYVLYWHMEQDKPLPKYVMALLVGVGLLFALLFTALPLFAYYKEYFYSYIHDPFAIACLTSPVTWNGWEFLTGVLYALMLLPAIYWLRRRRFAVGLLWLFYATAVFLMAYLVVVVPKVEGYSQRPAIEFYKSLQEKDAYVRPIGFKSYAHYFYARVHPGANPMSKDDQWLLSGDIDKVAYFVVKAHQKERMAPFADIVFLYEQGGFAFYVRYPKP